MSINLVRREIKASYSLGLRVGPSSIVLGFTSIPMLILRISSTSDL